MGEPSTTQIQFRTITIRGLLVVTTVIAVIIAPIAIWPHQGPQISISLFGLSLMVGVCVLCEASWVECLVASAVISILVFMLCPTTITGCNSFRASCMNNIRQIVLAAHNYQTKHLKFPPPFSVDENGQPLHSWRVHLLPYMDEGDLYDDLNLSKPWDHPDNIKHAHRMPNAFRCGCYQLNPKNRFDDVMTSYVAVIGKETVWSPTAGGLNFDDIKDGSSNTIMIVESDAHRVHWMSPLDVSFDEVVAQNEHGESDLFTSHHPGGSQVGMADGSARFVNNAVPVEEIKAALRIDDGKAGRLD